MLIHPPIRSVYSVLDLKNQSSQSSFIYACFYKLVTNNENNFENIKAGVVITTVLITTPPIVSSYRTNSFYFYFCKNLGMCSLLYFRSFVSSLQVRMGKGRGKQKQSKKNNKCSSRGRFSTHANTIHSHIQTCHR